MFFRAVFFAPALKHGSKTVGLVHKVVAYVDLFLICGFFLAGFGKGDIVLDLLGRLFNRHGWRPRGGRIVFV